MFGLPMDPTEVTLEVLREAFPTPDVVDRWHRGEDAEWPPEPEPVELRFAVGAAVLCRVGPGPADWSRGTVAELWYREDQWPDGAFAPYKIKLEDGRDIYAPQDVDPIIRRDDDTTAPQAPPQAADENTAAPSGDQAAAAVKKGEAAASSWDIFTIVFFFLMKVKEALYE
jgi:hypothetical protein